MPFFRPPWTDNLLAKRRRAAYGGCSRGTGSFFTRFNKAGSNVVESAAMLMGSVAAPHERWAELAGDDTTSVGEPDEGERPWR